MSYHSLETFHVHEFNFQWQESSIRGIESGLEGGRGRGEREGRKRRTYQRSFEIILNVRYGNEIRRIFGQNIHCYRGKFIRWIYFEWKMDVLVREREGIVVLFLLQAQSFTRCFTILLATFEVMPDVWI